MSQKFMTAADFAVTGIYYGMQIRHRDGNIYRVIGAHFEEELYHLRKPGADDDETFWARYENCQLIEDVLISSSARCPTTSEGFE